MNILKFKTLYYNKKSNFKFFDKKWFIVDAKDKCIGRLSSEIAKIIRGKNNPYYTPNTDCGDYVIILNANEVKFTGKKFKNKTYTRYSGYPGGKKTIKIKDEFKKNPCNLIKMAIKGMLPKNRLSDKLLKKNLYIYKGNIHKHESQKPNVIKI